MGPCAPLGRAAAAAAATRHGAVDFMLVIGSQGACHHGDWHVSLWMLDVHVQLSQLAAESRGHFGANAPTREHGHNIMTVKKDLYISSGLMESKKRIKNSSVCFSVRWWMSDRCTVMARPDQYWSLSFSPLCSESEERRLGDVSSSPAVVSLTAALRATFQRVLTPVTCTLKRFHRVCVSPLNYKVKAVFDWWPVWRCFFGSCRLNIKVLTKLFFFLIFFKDVGWKTSTSWNLLTWLIIYSIPLSNFSRCFFLPLIRAFSLLHFQVILHLITSLNYLKLDARWLYLNIFKAKLYNT